MDVIDDTIYVKGFKIATRGEEVLGFKHLLYESCRITSTTYCDIVTKEFVTERLYTLGNKYLDNVYEDMVRSE